MIVSVAPGEMVRVAVDSSNPLASPPGTAERAADPKFVVPDMKVTVPEGEAPKLPPEGFVEDAVSTNAVNVTCAPVAIVVLEAVSLVVVGAAATVKFATADGEVIAR